MRKPYVLGYVLIAALTVVWGISFPIGKLALREIDPWTARSTVLVSCGALLLFVSWFLGQSLRLNRHDLFALAKVAAFNIFGWHLLLAFGLRISDASNAVIIAYTMPVWAMILGVWILGETISFRSVTALILAITSLGILIGGHIGAVATNGSAPILLLLAAMCWAYGTILQKSLKVKLGLAAMAGWQLLLGAAPITLGMLLFGQPEELVTVSSTALGATYFSMIAMTFCYWAWFKVVEIFPAHVASIGVAAAPVFGVIASGLILGESLGWKKWGALFLVVAGLLLLAIPGRVQAFRKLRPIQTPVSSKYAN
ncbi:MAG: DMT family transporter [Geminicoccaceae bacterium]